jgi:hypothetical protein
MTTPPMIGYDIVACSALARTRRSQMATRHRILA